MKSFSLVDITFWIVVLLVFLTGSYEFIQLFAPVYHFWYVFWASFLFTAWYLYQKYEQKNNIVQTSFHRYLENIEFFLHLHFMGTIVMSIWSLFSQNNHLIVWLVGVFFLHFLFAKVHGYHISYRRATTNLSLPTIWKIFFISFVVYFLFLRELFWVLSLPFETQKIYYLYGCTLYLAVGGWLFLERGDFVPSEKVVSFNIALLIVLSLSLGIIVYSLFFRTTV